MVYKYDPSPSWTSQVQAHLCQVLIGLSVPFRPHPHFTPTNHPRPMMYSKLLSTKETSELDNFTGCVSHVLICSFFSCVTEMLFFPLIYHHLSPLPNQPVYFAFPWQNLISDKCISDADSIFLGMNLRFWLIRITNLSCNPGQCGIGPLTSCLCPFGLASGCSDYQGGFSQQ